MENHGKVLYVYRCAECGHRSEQHLAGDSHDGEASKCSACGAAVTLEWDGGVTLDASAALTDKWVIERFVRLARPGEGADLYEPWPSYDMAMSQPEAERALDECVRRWPDFEFRAHRVRVHEKIAAEAIARARRSAGAQ